MMRPSFLLSAFALLGFAENSQAQAPAAGFSRTPAGIEYQLFRKDAARRYQPRPLAVAADAPYTSRAGQFLTMFIEYRTGRDSVLMSSRRAQPVPQPFPLAPQPIQGSLEDALSLLLPGDSAVFRFQADSVFSKTFHQPVPAFIKKSGNTLLVLVSAHELISEADMNARQQKMQAEQQRLATAASAKQLAQDEAAILAYLKSKKATARKTPGGTYYLVTRTGTGPLPKKGQTVSVLYRGTILSTGKEFDASAKHGNEPFSFVLGQGQVIQGWDQGVAMLPKGAKPYSTFPRRWATGRVGPGPTSPRTQCSASKWR
jgi:FKBP-type peptidyl-prolyl cis-trans isomerase FkpA